MTNASKIWAFGAAFIIIAPLSTSGSAIGILKWLRLLTTVLAFYFSISNIKLPERLGGARSLFIFVLFFTFAARLELCCISIQDAYFFNIQTKDPFGLNEQCFQNMGIGRRVHCHRPTVNKWQCHWDFEMVTIADNSAGLLLFRL